MQVHNVIQRRLEEDPVRTIPLGQRRAAVEGWRDLTSSPWKLVPGRELGGKQWRAAKYWRDGGLCTCRRAKQ